ncbi:hypothetical protein E3N88_12883 [Mikania micrantha]|uniref:Reverse transcriptase Ty1/copia-type domain-containing protein n=1 Tax=Mikania micrantha TaxID=192012 RepID=A0A5N6P8S6_9ASTR|nr:hypothetical protein E3N88_12883 [Mikania micrantha]
MVTASSTVDGGWRGTIGGDGDSGTRSEAGGSVAGGVGGRWVGFSYEEVFCLKMFLENKQPQKLFLQGFGPPLLQKKSADVVRRLQMLPPHCQSKAHELPDSRIFLELQYESHPPHHIRLQQLVVPRIDYADTFSPVVKATTIRLVLSLAVTQQWPLRQLDIQNAFLHGDLQETVYLQQPPGFVDPAKPDHVCLLHKSLYGLKQAPRAWFHQLSTTLHKLGFQGSKTDPYLFVYSSGGTLLYMLVYVDDIVLTGNNPQVIDTVVQQLGHSFPVQDMGRLSYFLGVEVLQKGPDILLSQQKYILELLQKAGLTDSKPLSSPISTSANLALGDSPPFDNPARYRQVVGALQYATLSRPDISYAVNKVCQFMHFPTTNHWSTVKRILRYLKGTISYGLLVQQNSSPVLHAYADATFNTLTAFSDADWAGCPDDRRSTGGYAIYLETNLVSWSARKQKTVSRSSTESEYKALADVVVELTWLQTLLQELHVPIQTVPTLWCDNLGATYLSANPVFHARTKHVEVDFHFVREKVAKHQLSVQFISTDDQIADVFTKPLPSQRFLNLRSKLRVASRP